MFFTSVVQHFYSQILEKNLRIWQLNCLPFIPDHWLTKRVLIKFHATVWIIWTFRLEKILQRKVKWNNPKAAVKIHETFLELQFCLQCERLIQQRSKKHLLIQLQFSKPKCHCQKYAKYLFCKCKKRYKKSDWVLIRKKLLFENIFFIILVKLNVI